MGSVEERDKVEAVAEAPLAVEESVKSRILARTFQLPNELVLKDFTCAVYQTMLLHGRMYVSHNFVCFYSHFLGNEQVGNRRRPTPRHSRQLIPSLDLFQDLLDSLVGAEVYSLDIPQRSRVYP